MTLKKVNLVGSSEALDNMFACTPLNTQILNIWNGWKLFHDYELWFKVDIFGDIYKVNVYTSFKKLIMWHYIHR